LLHYISTAQHIKLRYSEKKLETDNGTDPVLVNSCYIKNFKFVETSYPDDVGRYFDSEYEVFVRVNNKYLKTVNSKVFNKEQNKLVLIINEQIQKEYKDDLRNPKVKVCFDELDSIPTYKMDDFEISFYENKILFRVRWGLPGVCRVVDGAIIIFKIDEVEKYLK
jgi:hypothetical protein